NPMTAMGGFARRLEDVAQNDKERKYAGIILKEMRRLEEILNDIVVFSQDRCCTAFELQQPREVIQENLEKHRDQLTGQNIKAYLDIESDLPRIPMDREKIHLILDNLISNSMHAMPQGGEISLTAGTTTAESGQGLVRISLTDTGPGLPEQVLEVLFEPFTTTKEHSLGTGLGLPLCKKIMEEHDGWIEGENLPDKGAAFYLYFPLSPENQA
ncbi:HAMP domain-containing sensor histidine kinase, partial [Desulfonatronospira sp.]